MSNKIIKSYWGVELSPRFIDAGSKKLCIILPGIGYCLDRSYLDYSKQLAKEIGYDVLEIEYGYQINRSEFNIEKEFSIMVSESLEVIDNAIEKEYEKREDIESCIIEGANHALDIEGKVMNTVDALKESLEIEKDFILR